MYLKAPLKGLLGPEQAFSAHNERSQNRYLSFETEEY